MRLGSHGTEDSGIANRSFRWPRFGGCFRLLLAVAILHGTSFVRAAEDEVVVLPPLVIEGEIPEPPWRYGVTERYEVLSSCTASTTRDLVRAITQATEALEVLLPPRFLPTPARSRGCSDVLILLDDAHWPARSRESVAALLRARRPLSAAGPAVPPADRPPAAAFPSATDQRRIQTLDRGGPLVWARRDITTAPEFYRHLRLMDDDVAVTFVLVAADDLDPRGWRLSAASVRESLERRVPQLPPWFVSGFLAVYSQLHFDDGRWTLAPMTWVNPAETRMLKSNPALAPDVLPLGEFLHPDDSASGTASHIRNAQAELLVRWALTTDADGPADQFWNWLEAACVRPATEETLFQAHFGYDFAEATDRLRKFRDRAVRETHRWRYAPSATDDDAALQLREAEPMEIARLKGNWERLETTFVRNRMPGLAERYRTQARRTLDRGLDLAPHDPAILSLLGLLNDEAGHASAARDLLEEAAKAGELPPLANTALARLRFEEVRGTTTSPLDAVPAAELQRVVEPLRAAVDAHPRTIQALRLLSRVWTDAAAAPPAEDLDRLVTGATHFPQDVPLAASVVRLLMESADFNRASQVAQLSLAHVAHAPQRVQLERLLREVQDSGRTSLRADESAAVP